MCIVAGRVQIGIRIGIVVDVDVLRMMDVMRIVAAVGSGIGDVVVFLRAVYGSATFPGHGGVV